MIPVSPVVTLRIVDELFRCIRLRELPAIDTPGPAWSTCIGSRVESILPVPENDAVSAPEASVVIFNNGGIDDHATF